jgi:hypothetical protein
MFGGLQLPVFGSACAGARLTVATSKVGCGVCAIDERIYEKSSKYTKRWQTGCFSHGCDLISIHLIEKDDLASSVCGAKPRHLIEKGKEHRTKES